MARRVYHSGKQFQSIEQLKDAIYNVWPSFDSSCVRGLYHSITKRLPATIENGERATKY